MTKLHRLQAAPSVGAALLTAAFWVALLPQAAAAEPPSQAQTSAIRQACRADYRAHCASVPAGDRPHWNACNATPRKCRVRVAKP
jgi:hypothetical protein